MKNKHIIIPLCLFVYMLVMAYIGRDLWKADPLKYSLILAAEVAVLVFLFFTLRRRERLRQQRREEEERLRKEKKD